MGNKVINWTLIIIGIIILLAVLSIALAVSFFLGMFYLLGLLINIIITIIIPLIMIALIFFIFRKASKTKRTSLSLIILILYFIFFSFIITVDYPVTLPRVEGKVIDSSTGNPVSNLEIVRYKPAIINQIVDSNIDKKASYYKKVYTDENGKFIFEKDKFKINRPRILTGDEDFLIINHKDEKEIYLDASIRTEFTISENERFYPSGFDVDKIKQFDIVTEENGLLVVKISPKVESLEECNGDIVCRQDNIKDIAFKNKDEDLCLEIKEIIHDDFGRGSHKRADCVAQIALEKKDLNVCQILTIKSERDWCESFENHF